MRSGRRGWRVRKVFGPDNIPVEVWTCLGGVGSCVSDLTAKHDLGG